jgi:hypothetical protein
MYQTIAFIVLLIAAIILVIGMSFRKKEYLVVSLTTSPKRIHKIKPMLDSIFAQTIKPDRIILNLPKVFQRTGDTFSLPLPDFITSNKLVHVNFCDDIGPATKVVSSIPLVSDPSTFILSVDDDIYYPPYIIELYTEYARLFPNCIISGSTFIDNYDRLDNKWFRSALNRNNMDYFQGKPADLLEGFSGVLYRRDYFTKELLSDFYKHIDKKSCRLGDDFYLSNLFKKYRRKIISAGIQVSHNQFNTQMVSPLHYGLREDALHKRKDVLEDSAYDGNHNNYRSCSKVLNHTGDLYID